MKEKEGRREEGEMRKEGEKGGDGKWERGEGDQRRRREGEEVRKRRKRGGMREEGERRER
jgi:hypothetical protein